MKLQEFTDLKDTCPVCKSNLILRLTDCTDPSKPLHMNVDQLIGLNIIKCHHKALSIFINLKKNIYVFLNKDLDRVNLSLDIICKKDCRHYTNHSSPFELPHPTTTWLDLPSIELS